MARVLVVEDEHRLRTFLVRTLEADGHAVSAAATGPDGVLRHREDVFDLVVLDLMLPGYDGFEVLRLVLDRVPDQRVVVLSAAMDVGTRVRCFQMGAVDYLAKPFAAAELVERVRTRLRTPAPLATQRWLTVGDVTLDLERQSLTTQGTEVLLSHREFLVVVCLMRRAGHTCSRQELLADVWGYDADDMGSNVVEVTVRRLRTKLPRSLIQTVRNVGYTFVEG